METPKNPKKEGHRTPGLKEILSEADELIELISLGQYVRDSSGYCGLSPLSDFIRVDFETSNIAGVMEKFSSSPSDEVDVAVGKDGGSYMGVMCMNVKKLFVENDRVEVTREFREGLSSVMTGLLLQFMDQFGLEKYTTEQLHKNIFHRLNGKMLDYEIKLGRQQQDPKKDVLLVSFSYQPGSMTLHIDNSGVQEGFTQESLKYLKDKSVFELERAVGKTEIFYEEDTLDKYLKDAGSTADLCLEIIENEDYKSLAEHLNRFCCEHYDALWEPETIAEESSVNYVKSISDTMGCVHSLASTMECVHDTVLLKERQGRLKEVAEDKRHMKEYRVMMENEVHNLKSLVERARGSDGGDAEEAPVHETEKRPITYN